jgi:sugar lactone lactonase YvrE
MRLITPFIILLPFLNVHCKKSQEKEKTATVSTIAGTGQYGYQDASALFAKFYTPRDIAVHTDGAMYIADATNHRIRKMVNGMVTTIAGNGGADTTNGNGSAARFNELIMIALDPAGNTYILDASNYRVRKMTPGADVSNYAGTGEFGFADGPAHLAKFKQVWGIVSDPQGNIIVADSYNNCIRKISTDGQVTTIAGTGTIGYTDGPAADAQFYYPYGLALDKQGNLFVADVHNFRIRKITPKGIVSTFAGSGIQGKVDGIREQAKFFSMLDMVADSKGNLYVTDGNTIRKISSDGVVTTIAGDHGGGYADGPGITARFKSPTGLAIDNQDNIYVADAENHCIRKIRFQ